MVKVVFFDLDNTMYDFDSCNSQGMKALRDYACKTLKLDRDEFENTYWSAARSLERKIGKDNSAIHNILIRTQNTLEQLQIPYEPHALSMAELYWKTFFEYMRPEPYLIEMLEALKMKGLKLGVGTNMTADIQFKKLQLLQVLSYMDMVITSEEALSEKPNRHFFRCCFEKAERMAGAVPGECVFVGDSFTHDVLGAIKSGMIPVWYNPKGQEKPSVPYENSGYHEKENYRSITSFRELGELPWFSGGGPLSEKLQ